MNFEPQKFFIGVIDFFSIMLPGALLTFMIIGYVDADLMGEQYHALVVSNAWIAYLFSSYLLGHFIFLIGSWMDEVYDSIRKATYDEQIRKLAIGKKLSMKLTRWLASNLIKPVSDKAVRQAVSIKNHYLNPLKASSTINAFQWCKARLTLEQPEALAAVQRFEADSKFFRSLLVVLFILIIWGLIVFKPWIVLGSFPLIVLAFLRYVDQRVKATNQAYWYIITLEGNSSSGFRQTSGAQTNGASHAGGVVFRQLDDKVEYLLVQAKNAPQEWVLPKGHIETGERMQETAVREVREETGVWARIRDKLNEVTFNVGGKHIEIQFFLMEVLEEGKPAEKREHKWLSLDAALHRATHEETKDLISFAEQKRNAL